MFTIWVVILLLIINSSSAKSYNQPNLSLCASWNSNAMTIANKSVVGLQPAGIYVNTENTIYVADRQNGRVLVWANGSSTSTRNISSNLTDPWSLFVTMDGNIYVDKWMLNVTNSEPVLTVHSSCTGLFVVESTNTLYCSSVNEHYVVKVQLNSEAMIKNIVAGTGCSGPVFDTLDRPHGIFVDINFNLYVADTDNNRIQCFAPGQLSATTVAGFGAPVQFKLNRPTSIVLDADGYMFIAESHNHRIIRSIPNGFQCVVGCSGESGATSSQLHNPQMMAFDSDGHILVTDFNNHRIQKFILAINTCGKHRDTTIEGTTQQTTKLASTEASKPNCVPTVVTNKKIPLRASVVDIHPNAKWAPSGLTVAGGNGFGNGISQLYYPSGLYVDDDQTVYVADPLNHRIVERKYGATSSQVVAGGNAQGNGAHQLSSPADVIIDKERDSLIICDSGNMRVVRWPRRNGITGETIISNISCRGLTMDENGYLYAISDNEVRRYRIGDTEGTVVAGGNGQGGRLDQFSAPGYVFVDRDHSVYVSDWANTRVMKWEECAKQGIVVAGGQGQGNSLAQLWSPSGVVVDQLGTVYVADASNSRIMRWPKGVAQGSVVVGETGQGGGQSNRLSLPLGLSFDRHGNLYVADQANNRVQKFNIEQTKK